MKVNPIAIIEQLELLNPSGIVQSSKKATSKKPWRGGMITMSQFADSVLYLTTLGFDYSMSLIANGSVDKSRGITISDQVADIGMSVIENIEGIGIFALSVVAAAIVAIPAGIATGMGYKYDPSNSYEGVKQIGENVIANIKKANDYRNFADTRKTQQEIKDNIFRNVIPSASQGENIPEEFIITEHPNPNNRPLNKERAIPMSEFLTTYPLHNNPFTQNLQNLETPKNLEKPRKTWKNP